MRSRRRPHLFLSASADLQPIHDAVVASLPPTVDVFVHGDGPEQPVGSYANALASADLYVGIVSEKPQSLYAYSEGESSHLAWEFEHARASRIDVRMFRKAHLNSRNVNPEHARFIYSLEAASAAVPVETFETEHDLSRKVLAAVLFWRREYWRSILERRQRERGARRIAFACAVLGIPASVGALAAGWLTLVPAVTIIGLCLAAGALTLLLTE